MKFTEQYVQTRQGLRLFAESAGDPSCPPVLLVMGAMNQGLFWYDPFCVKLAAAGYYVIRYDHRDTGLSSTVDFGKSPYDLDDLADDALSILGAYGAGKAHIIGLSMGGYIGQLLAVNHPERVRTLTLISTTADHRPYMDATTGKTCTKYDLPFPDARFLEYLKKGMADPPTNEKEMREFVLKGWKIMSGKLDDNDIGELARLIDLSAGRSKDKFSAFNHGPAVQRSPERTGLLKEKGISAPVFIFHGTEDPCLPPRHGEFLHEVLPGSRLEMVAGMGHMFSLAESGNLADRIIRNIKGK